MKHQKTMRFRNKITGEIREISRHLFNSALVSAQNRQRYYWTNIPNVPQPTDRGILLKDILESGASWTEKGYCLTSSYNGAVAWNTIERKQRSMVAEPVCVAQRGRYTRQDGGVEQNYEARADGKTNTITKVQKDNMVAEPIRIGALPRPNGELSTSQGMRIYSIDGKSVTQSAQGGGLGAKTGLYACPVNDIDGKAHTIKAQYYKNGIANFITNGGFSATAVAEKTDTKQPNIYEVINGLIRIKDKQYPIKLPDGFYIIRKLTVLECKRLQTVRDNYIMPCSNSQNYKMLGNGWTVDVIVHILSHIPNIENCEVEVLSMYDGMSCGNLALEKLGCKISKYISYEIDKYAIETTQANFPYVIQKGDAFQLRNDEWGY